MAELNSEGRYDDLVYTNFPAELDSWEDRVDVMADTLALANQYRDYCVAGNYAEAQNLLENDETGTLKRMQINAMSINQITHAVMAMERLFKTDVETYVKDQVFADDLMIWTYKHSYDADTKVHNFTGKGVNCKAKCTATFKSGDTIAVNGVSVPAYAGPETIENAGSDIIINGRWVTFTYDGTQVNFKAGGGVSSSMLAQATANEKYVLKGKKFYAGNKEVKNGAIPNLSLPKDRGGDATTSVNASNMNSGVDVVTACSMETNTDGVKRVCMRPDYGAFGGADKEIGSDGYVGVNASAFGTAWQSNVLEGTTFTSGNTNKVADSGSMPNRGGTGFTYGGSNITIPYGYYNGSGTVSVSGGNQGSKSFVYSGSNITVPQGWYNGAGSVSCAGGNQGSFNRTINPGGSVTIPQGYHNGGGRIYANAVSKNDITGALRTGTTKVGVNVGRDRYIVGITKAILSRWPGDGSVENGEWSYLQISDDHHTINGAGNGAGTIDYVYIQL